MLFSEKERRNVAGLYRSLQVDSVEPVALLPEPQAPTDLRL